ncbi:MAG TPA: FtsX-like permease family protein [Gaiellaceae bacterium]|nr:FtsX-like permease family protein [Gaiellaceae bacterium]
MASALLRKSITDLSRRRSRTFFAVATLALAVASIGIFAMPTLIDRAMQKEVTAGKLADVTVWIGGVPLEDSQLARLAALPNVRAVEPRSYFSGRVYVGARRAPIVVVGVRDFASQQAEIVRVTSGSPPRENQVLTEAQNASRGGLGAGAGDLLRVVAGDGSERLLRVTGVGHNLNEAKDVVDGGAAVLYATTGTVASLSGSHGYGSLAFRLADTRPAATRSTIESVRNELAPIAGFRGFTGLPETRAAGEWPGKEDFQKFTDFFSIVTVLALLSALVLIANTMTTLVAEQTAEIGTMKAIGGRRRQIAAVYVKTAMLLGTLGTVVGVGLGIVLSNVLIRFLGSEFFAVDVGFGVDAKIIVLSVLVGVLGPALAALPAIRRATRVPLREALDASGSAVGAEDAGDRLLRRVRFLPRTAQIGLRNAGRRRRRSLATAVIVALAVGNLLAVMGLAAAIASTTHAEWRDHGEDVKITSESGTGLYYGGADLIRSVPGVADVEPIFDAKVVLRGEDGIVWSVHSNTMFHVRISDGHWFTAAQERARERVAVVGRNIARVTGTKVGDRVRLDTAAGPATFRVIGITPSQQENGTVIFVPYRTMHAILGEGAAGTDYWVRTTVHDHAFVDRTTTRIEDTLANLGYGVSTEIEYVGEADNVAANRMITTVIAVLGFLIVAISMVGLANALTMSVIERTREVGILRTIGARARDVRRIFAAESVALAVAGWALGIPVGYLLDRFLVWLVQEVVNVEVPFVFPLANVAYALVGTVVLALVITWLPIRRAVRYRPGNALRYA